MYDGNWRHDKKHGKDGGVFAQKVPHLRTFTEDNPLTEIVPEMQARGHRAVCARVACYCDVGSVRVAWRCRARRSRGGMARARVL